MLNKKQILTATGLLAIAAALLLFIHEPSQKQKPYIHNTGRIFGTYYSIKYESDNDEHEAIKEALQAIDNSLSMFNPKSTLSKINNNEDNITDTYMEKLLKEAQSVSAQSNGAFDITVAPLVNIWGFGFENKADISQEKIDSVMEFIGYQGLSISERHIEKADERMKLDAGAIAKGYACDITAELLRSKGCNNYLIEIGGEIVALGNNQQGEAWQIGITKPIDDPSGETQELQATISSHDIKMATSGNYRNYYYKGSEKRSHTIDPRTGYPVNHSLLSATVTANTCLKADALATTCMVLGADEAMSLIEQTENAECYLIVAQGDSLEVRTSSKWQKQQAL